MGIGLSAPVRSLLMKTDVEVVTSVGRSLQPATGFQSPLISAEAKTVRTHELKIESKRKSLALCPFDALIPKPEYPTTLSQAEVNGL